MQLVFATHNPNKAREINAILGDRFEILTLDDIGCTEEIPETAPDLEGNARIKAAHVVEHYNRNCFADDTGLEIAALNGEPGVYSARYAGPQKDANANMNKVLAGLEGKADRSARFRTVISLMLDGVEHQFEGIVSGTIIPEKRGREGFGYDPIFVPDGYTETFAELSAETKNAISHRGRAVARLVQFLENQV